MEYRKTSIIYSMLGSRRLVIINRSRLTLSRCLEIHHCERKSHVAGNKPSRDAFPQMHDCIYRDVWSQDFLSDRAAVRCFNHFLADIISGLHAGGISQDQVVPFDLVENRELHSWKPNSNCWRHPTMCGLPQPILQRYFVVRQTQDAIGFRDRVPAFDVGEFAAILLRHCVTQCRKLRTRNSKLLNQKPL